MNSRQYVHFVIVPQIDRKSKEQVAYKLLTRKRDNQEFIKIRGMMYLSKGKFFFDLFINAERADLFNQIQDRLRIGNEFWAEGEWNSPRISKFEYKNKKKVYDVDRIEEGFTILALLPWDSSKILKFITVPTPTNTSAANSFEHPFHIMPSSTEKKENTSQGESGKKEQEDSKEKKEANSEERKGISPF